MNLPALSHCTAIAPNIPAAACRKFLRAISDLREKLEGSYASSQPQGVELVRASFAEAEALARENRLPHLFLPLLAEEKVSLAFAARSTARHRLAHAA